MQTKMRAKAGFFDPAMLLVASAASCWRETMPKEIFALTALRPDRRQASLTFVCNTDGG
jgi:hypothetical protein